MPCNLCGGTSIEVVSLEDRSGDYLRTVICRECGLIWTDLRSSIDEVKAFYSGGYRKEYKGKAKPRLKHIYRDANEAIRRFRFLNDIVAEGDRILDVGAGTGVFVYVLRELGYNAEGIEPDEAYSLYCREEFGIPIRTCFLEEYQMTDFFDIVTMHHVLEHFADPYSALKKIWLLMKKNAFLIVEVPNAEDIRQDPKHRYHKAHLYTFNPETLTSIVRKAGFTARKITVGSLNGNISAIFQRMETYDHIIGGLPGNYEKIKKILTDYSRLRHFLSLTPYKTLLDNIMTAIQERAAVREFKEGRVLVDSIVSKFELYKI